MRTVYLVFIKFNELEKIFATFHKTEADELLEVWGERAEMYEMQVNLGAQHNG